MACDECVPPNRPAGASCERAVAAPRERGFAGARRSHHSYKFTRSNLQRDSTQSTNASLTKKVSLFQVTYSNYRLRRRSGSRIFTMFTDSRGALLALSRWLIIVGSHNVSSDSLG